METYISKEEMLKYFRAGMSEELAQVREQGLQRGIQQGRQEGAQQTLNLTAMNALKRGLSLKTISDITSLPIAEIKKLKSRM